MAAVRARLGTAEQGSGRLGRVRDVEVEHRAEQREPGHQVGRVSRRPRRATRRWRPAVRRRSGSPSTSRSSRAIVGVRRGDLVGLAHDANRVHVRRARLRARPSSRVLPTPASPDDTYRRARRRCVPRRIRARESIQLGGTADERQVERGRIVDGSARRRDTCPTSNACDRRALALHVHRRERGGRETRRPVEHVGRRDDRAGPGRGHEPRRQVHGVAHHGVRAAVLRADVAREDGTAVDADAHRNRRDRRRRCGARSRAFALRRDPARDGAPAVSTNLPPSASTSDASNATSCAAHALLDRASRAPRARARCARGPSRARRSSRPSKCTNATVTTRCSGVAAPGQQVLAHGGGDVLAQVDVVGRSVEVVAVQPGLARARGEAGTRRRAARRRNASGSAAAVAALMTIWPGASRRAPSRRPRSRPRPSRAARGSVRPTRKQSNVPECTPTDMRSRTAARRRLSGVRPCAGARASRPPTRPPARR